MPAVRFRGDYPFNGGSMTSTGTPDRPRWAQPHANGPTAAGREPGNPFGDMSATNGVAAQRSQVKMCDITDGTSNTYLVGEKYLDPDLYYTGQDGATTSAGCGDDDETVRWTEMIRRRR